MIIFNTVFLDSKLLLWGETSPTQNNPNFNGQNHKVKPHNYPYSISLKILQDVFTEIAFDAKSLKKNLRAVAVWLPTIIAETSNSRPKTCRFPWLIDTFELFFDRLIQFLNFPQEKKFFTQESSLVPMLFFRLIYVVFPFLLLPINSICQQYPLLTTSILYAFWESTFVGQNKVFLEAQTKLMLAISRALTPINTSAQPEQSSLYITRRLIKSLVDHIVRTKINPSTTKSSSQKNLRFGKNKSSSICINTCSFNRCNLAKELRNFPFWNGPRAFLKNNGNPPRSLISNRILDYTQENLHFKKYMKTLPTFNDSSEPNKKYNFECRSLLNLIVLLLNLRFNLAYYAFE